ncbi:MAG TPA: uroporphyrinogen-III synthase [Steroidobacteraceae bacterium]|nr:uroporphyrinogen-III synthase [Steroidobacteraceae bacterium]
MIAPLPGRGMPRAAAGPRCGGARAAAADGSARPELERWPVAVTRDEPAAGPLASQLRQLGLTVLSWPVLRIAAPPDPAPLQRARACLADFDWVIFASQHAAAAVAVDMPAPRARVAAVGEHTAQALRAAGWPVHVVPEGAASAAGLLAALAGQVAPGERVLLPASSRALPALAAGLRQLGARVEQVTAYEARPGSLDAAALSLVDRDAVGAVTFTSPSAVQELDRLLGPKRFDRLLQSAWAVTLGTTTARALAARGYESVLAQPADFAGLARTTQRLVQLRA